MNVQLEKEMNLDWLLGFIEGEGSFGIRASKSKSAKFKCHLCPWFKISQKEKEVLKKITIFLEKQNIKVRVSIQSNEKRKKEYGWNCSDSHIVYTNCVSDCLKIRNLLRNLNWQTNKYEVFCMWSTCLDMIKEGRHNTVEGFLEICKIRDKMNKNRPKGYRTYSDMCKLLGIWGNDTLKYGEGEEGKCEE